MKKFLQDYNLKVRLPIIIFVAASVFALTYYSTFAERNNIGYTPDQPIAYSHKLHAGTMNIDCQYCHVGVEKSRFASVPSADVCMNCHVLARKDKPEIIKLTEYYEKNIPIPWKRIHRLPDFAYFNHASHVNQGIDCQNCHGNMRETEVVGQVKSLTMGACIQCHRAPDENVAVINPNNINKISKATQLNKGPDNCSTCHR